MPSAANSGSSKLATLRPARWRWSSRLAFLVMVGVAGCTLAGAALGLSREATHQTQEFRAAAGVVFLVCAFWQAWILRHVYSRRDRLKAFTLGLISPFWQWLILALAGSYSIALAIGPGAAAQNAFAALAVFSYTAVLYRYTRKAKQPALAARGVNSPRFSVRQTAAWGICGLIVAGFGAEISLRVIDFFSDQPTPVANFVRRSTLPVGVEYRGRVPNQLGFWDDEFHLTAKDQTNRRVVILGDELTMTGDAESNFVSLLDQRLSQTDVQHFGVSGASPREYAVVLSAEAAQFRPDVVLVMVNLANDITDAPRLPGAFEWRGLRLYEWSLRRWKPESLQPAARISNEHTTRDYATLLQIAEQDLTVCRAPMTSDVRGQWQATFASLRNLQATCQRLGAELVVVAVPSRAQVDVALQTAARRRLGLSSAEVDGSLPQRRMIAFAEQSKIAFVDLTPVIGSEGADGFTSNCTEWTGETHRRLAEFLSPVIASRLDGTAEMFAAR